MRDIYILNDKKIDLAKNIPVISIKYIKQDIDLLQYDILIFTSKNSVYSINSFNHNWKNIKSYAIAEQTARVISELGGKLEFIGKTKHGDSFANEILDSLKDKKVLYLRGTKVVSNLINILKDGNIEIDEMIIYKTTCIEDNQKIVIPKNSIIIFSSPSTIKCFFKSYSWDNSFVAISIGNTTAKYFNEYNIKPIISDDTSLNSCVKKALEIINDI